MGMTMLFNHFYWDNSSEFVGPDYADKIHRRDRLIVSALAYKVVRRTRSIGLCGGLVAYPDALVKQHDRVPTWLNIGKFIFFVQSP